MEPSLRQLTTTSSSFIIHHSSFIIHHSSFIIHSLFTAKGKSMAAFHTRSHSFPSRPHPLTSLLDEQLRRLSSSESASTSTSLHLKFNGLQDLHESVEKWLQLPSTQQSLEKENADELLDGFLRLLDLCNSARDALSQTKERVQDIQSMLRRRRGFDMELVGEVKKYLSAKKAIRKAISRVMKNLKHKEHEQSLLGEVEAVSSDVLKSLLSLVAGPELERKNSGLSLVSKLLHKNRVKCEEEQGMNEIASAESAMLSLIKGKSDKAQNENVQAELHKSESCIQDLEEGLEGLFRNLIKVRVTLLNVLN